MEIEAKLISAPLRRISVANRGGLGYNEDNEPRPWGFWPSGAVSVDTVKNKIFHKGGKLNYGKNERMRGERI
ncbi:MAG: hypothetical protein LUD69_00080 [Oscillospiraceae bacterium]|nr:hypothetical protein [Oscillospiraceae bacterium]